MKNIIKIGTRKSKLALIQTDIVKDKIKKVFPEREIRSLINPLLHLVEKVYLLLNLKPNFFLVQ